MTNEIEHPLRVIALRLGAIPALKAQSSIAHEFLLGLLKSGELVARIQCGETNPISVELPRTYWLNVGVRKKTR